MHGIKREVEPQEEQEKMQSPESLAVHLAGHLRKPIIEGSKKRKQNPPNDDVVEVRYHKVGIPELPIKRCRTQHDAGEARYEELEKKANAKQHGCLEFDLASPHGCEPVEDLNAGRDGNGHRGQYKERVRIGTQAHCEHVMGPDAPADKADGKGSRHHDRIAKDSFSRKYRNNLGYEGKGG